MCAQRSQIFMWFPLLCYSLYCSGLELNTQNFQGKTVEKLKGNSIRNRRVNKIYMLGIAKRQEPWFWMPSTGSWANSYNLGREDLQICKYEFSRKHTTEKERKLLKAEAKYQTSIWWKRTREEELHKRGTAEHCLKRILENCCQTDTY